MGWYNIIENSTAKSADFTASAGDGAVYNLTSSNLTITLDSGTLDNAKFQFVDTTNSGTNRLVPNGGLTINGSNVGLSTNNFFTVRKLLGKWYVDRDDVLTLGGDPLAWYRADLGVALSASSNYVSGWNDLSINGYNLGQTTASSEFLFKSSDSNISSLAAVTGSGGQFMSSSATISSSTASGGVTVAVVVNIASFTGRMAFFHIGDTATDTTAGNITGYFDTNGGVAISDSNNGTNWEINSAGPGDFTTGVKGIIILRADANTNDNGASIRINGIEVWTRDGGTTGTYTGWPANKTLFLGAGRVGSVAITNDLNGDMAEFILFNKRLGDQDTLQLETYLNDRYGVF